MSSPFDQKKKSILDEISLTLALTPDASPKGTIDHLCIPIIESINSHPDMVTTSLCSGRVSVFLEGNKKDSTQIGAKGNEGRWLFVSHEPEKLPGWYNSIEFEFDELSPVSQDTRYILYKFEPLILHVKCRDLATANLLYLTAMGCGFRETGIGSNNIVGIRISIKLDVPIGHLQEERYILVVPKTYLELITKLSLDRFEENFRKMAQLKASIEQMGTAAVKVVETKEEKRLRMKREGLERRGAVREEKEKAKLEKAKLEQAKANELR